MPSINAFRRWKWRYEHDEGSLLDETLGLLAGVALWIIVPTLIISVIIALRSL